MQRFRFLGMLLLVPALAVFLAAGGCGKKDGTKKNADKEEQANKDEGEKKDDGKGEEAEGAKTELASKGWGTLKGTVYFDGEIPKPAVIEQAKTHKDHAVCEQGDITEQTWRVKEVDGNKVVANAVVYLRPPAGKVFKIDMDKKTWPDVITVDQPHCAFEPHISVAFPDYYDVKAKKMKSTGQKIEVKNSAPVTHNTRWKGNDLINPGASLTLAAKSGDKFLNVKLDDSHPQDLISLNCDLHKWMSGKIWAFDHPYAAVTDKDGKFEIKNVPTGVDLLVVCWHEAVGNVNGAKGEKMKLDKETTKDFKIKKK